MPKLVGLSNAFNRPEADNLDDVYDHICASIVDQRLPDFLILTALNGGNGQPRALQFSVRLGF